MYANISTHILDTTSTILAYVRHPHSQSQHTASLTYIYKQGVFVGENHGIMLTYTVTTAHITDNMMSNAWLMVGTGECSQICGNG